MFSFQGDFKRQRNINLGGSRRNDPNRSNAQAVLSKAHEERQRRELERRRQRAASCIQRYWRGMQATAAWRQGMRESWNEAVLSCQPISPADAYDAIACFTAYYSGSQADEPRLYAILQWLFGGTDGAASHYHQIISLVSQQAEGAWPGKAEWAALVSRLLGSALKAKPAANGLGGSGGAGSAGVGIVLNSLRCAFTLGDSSAAVETLVLKNMIASKGLYEYLAKTITDADRKTHSDSAAAAASLAVLPFEFDVTRELAVPYFARRIMAVPGLPNKIGVRGVASFTRNHIPWEQLARQVGAVMEQQLAESTASWFGGFGKSAAEDGLEGPLSAISSMGNLAAFILPQLPKHAGSSSLATAFIEASAACARMIPSCNLFGTKSKRNASASPAISRGARLAKAVDTHALRWLKAVFSVQVLELLVHVCCNEAGENISKTARDAQVLLLVFIQQWGESVGSTVLDNLLQVVDIRMVGWRKMLSDAEFLACFAGDRVKVETIKSRNLVAFQLLCEVLNRQLQTIGDDELFRQGMSLSVDDIKVVARACRNIAFALHWAQATAGDLVHIRDTATALTRQLFIRDTRHPFVEEGFWLVPPSLLDMSSFADRVAEDPIFTAGNSSSADDSDDSNVSSSSSDSESDSDEEVSGVGIGSRDSRASWLMSTYSGLARSRHQRKEQSMLAPRIAVLRHIPFVVPFSDRVRLFHALINRDRSRLGVGSLGNITSSSPFGMHTAARATVRRGRIFDDGFRALFPVLSGKPVLLPPSPMQEDDLLDGRESQLASRAPHERATPHARLPGGWGFNAGGGFDAGEPMNEDDMEFAEDGQGGMSDPFFWGLPQMTGRPSLQGPSGAGGVGNSSSRSGRSDMFKRRMQIEFVDRYGMPEAGIDGGGVFKEFLTSLVREAFDPGEGLFNATAQNNLYPNPESVSVDAADKQLMLDKYEFLGAVIGKALYEGVLVDAPFALFFLGRWLSQLPGFNDLPTLDEDLYRGLVVLKNYPVPETSNGDSSDEDDVIYSVFGLDFTTTVSTADGQTKSVPLAPKGDAIKVTSHNRLLYLDLVAQYKLVKQIDTPVRAFLSGLHAIIPPVWLRLLFASPLELSRLLCGDSGAIDITDWKRNTVYAGAFSGRGSEHPTVRIFWDVVENSLTERQCRELCKFATSCERPPLLGFSELNPRFCIRSSDDGDESLLTDEREQNARLPSASTCVNLLKLPIYSSRQVLLEKLTTAIESGAGFDLS